MEKEKIVIAGGSGFLGTLLSKFLSSKGYQVIILSRKSLETKDQKLVYWDGETLGEWSSELENALALVNLAGRSVDCRYNEKNKQVMTNSRILSTRILGEAVKNCKNPPKVWLNSSTATIYEHTYGTAHSEDGRIAPSPDIKDEFSIQLASSWEEEFNKIECPETRKILLRTAIVFDQRGSVHKVLKKIVRLRLGGTMGHGKQLVSWIHSSDFCNALLWLIGNKNASGIYNISSKNPVPNKQMMKILREKAKAPFGLPATKWMLEIGAFFLRTETELILKSRNVIPTRLISEGFNFKVPKFEDAVNMVNDE